MHTGFAVVAATSANTQRPVFMGSGPGPSGRPGMTP
jgi:hypothetical protein